MMGFESVIRAIAVLIFVALAFVLGVFTPMAWQQVLLWAAGGAIGSWPLFWGWLIARRAWS